MIRFSRLNLAAALVLMLPATALGQADSRYTREATKHLGIAMTRPDEASKAKSYQDALVFLREGMEREPNNAKVWLLAGTVYAGLGQFREAHDAWTKAQQMHAAYAEEIEGEREAAWIEAFNRGAQAMDERNYPRAIELLELAQLLYKHRPEALMNLGALYANENQYDKAEKAFEDAVTAINGPLYAKLDPETQASWTRFRDMAKMNIAQMAGAQGVAAFERQDFAAAQQAFRKATEVNPHSRDYWFNLTQAYWAQASALEDRLESTPAAEQAAVKQELTQLFGEVIKLSQKVREMDPNSELLYILEARSERMIGEFGPQAQQKAQQDKALALLEKHGALTVDLSEIVAQVESGTAVVQGKVKNRKLAEGAPVTVRFTLLGLDGKVLAEQDVTVNVGAPESAKEFELRAPVQGEVAGWKYVIRS